MVVKVYNKSTWRHDSCFPEVHNTPNKPSAFCLIPVEAELYKIQKAQEISEDSCSVLPAGKDGKPAALLPAAYDEPVSLQFNNNSESKI